MTRLSRRDLRLIREAQGWEAAANAAGVRKTKKVVSKTGKTYYRPLTKDQRRYRISNIIQQKQALRQKKKKPTARDRKKLQKAIDKIKEARLAIPEQDRVKAGRDLQIKDQIKAARARLRRAENEANKKQIQRTIDGLQEELQSDEAEEEVQRAHELAQDTDRNDDWNLFKLGYNSTSKRQRTKFKKALKERLGDNWPDLDDDFQYRVQKRPWSKKKYIRSKIASLDTETQSGDIQTLHTASLGKTEDLDRSATFNHREEGVPFSFSILFGHIIRNHSWETRKDKKRKYWTLPHFFAWNLGFDGDVMMKTLPWPTLEAFSRSSKQVIDLETGWLSPGVIKVRNRWEMEDGSRVPKNRYASFFYIRKKCLIIEPLFHYVKGRKVTPFHLYDVAQLYKERRLQHAASTYLGEGKDDMNAALMGEGGDESDHYWKNHMKEIIEYGEKDALLTARLSWIRLNEYQDAGVCVFKPLSKASIARNNLFRLAERNQIAFPSLDDYMNNPLTHHVVLAALSSYGGGWFEMRGAGSISNVIGVDLVLAYPHVMNFLPDIRQLSWITDEIVGAEGIEEYLKTHRLYWPAFVYASMKFPPGLPFYPMATWNDDYGTVQNPRNVTRWFTADEVVEAQKWNAEIEIFHGTYSIVESADRIEVEEDEEPPQGVEDGVNYPFRVALETFYGGKAAIDLIPEEDRTETEHSAREVYKIMINSLYGLCLCTINDDGVEATGSMWNPIYASLITAGCRMRIAEIMRLNNHSVISVATDGVVLPAAQVLDIPPNPLPIEGWTLGNWEVEAKGDFFAIGSGVYSIISEKGKTTVRGHASRFINPKEEDWREWCEKHGQEESVKMTFKAPYSMGEARVRSNFELVGKFREQTATMRPTMDANKRPRWEDIPKKFEDLVNGWFVSHPPEYLTRKVR